MKLSCFSFAAFMLMAVTAQECHDYVLISVRGTTEPQGPSAGFPGMISGTFNSLPGGLEYDAVYPADGHLKADLGGDDVQRYIKAGLLSCPDQKYAVLGYSQGATATAIGLRSIAQINDTKSIDALKAIVVIGNPGHVPNATANVDQFGGKTTSPYEGAFYFGGAGRIPQFYYDQNKVLDICYQKDIICAPSYPDASPPYHGLYGGDKHVQQMGADFLVDKLKSGTIAPSTPSNSTSGNPTTTSSSPTPSGTVVTYLGAAHDLRPSRLVLLCFVVGSFLTR